MIHLKIYPEFHTIITGDINQLSISEVADVIGS